MTTQGGKREGAGRKPEIVDPVRFEMFLPRKMAQEIDERAGKGNRANYIRAALHEKLLTI